MMDEAELFLSVKYGMYMLSLFTGRRSRSWRCVRLWAIVAPVWSAGSLRLLICTFQASFHAVVARTIFFAALHQIFESVSGYDIIGSGIRDVDGKSV